MAQISPHVAIAFGTHPDFLTKPYNLVNAGLAITALNYYFINFIFRNYING
jgi:hypothetical protein